ncbi:hypothetical protein BC628DRAFT_1427960 [Trametes gibbosa]|nr:hypothetical protein BC628DRAFT_1427960 [Trametes gibbosa]
MRLWRDVESCGSQHPSLRGTSARVNDLVETQGQGEEACATRSGYPHEANLLQDIDVAHNGEGCWSTCCVRQQTVRAQGEQRCAQTPSRRPVSHCTKRSLVVRILYRSCSFRVIPAISMVMRMKGHNGLSPCRMCTIQPGCPHPRFTSYNAPCSPGSV